MNVKKKPYFYKKFGDDGFGKEVLIKFWDHAYRIHQNTKVDPRWGDKQIHTFWTRSYAEENLSLSRRLQKTQKGVEILKRSGINPNLLRIK